MIRKDSRVSHQPVRRAAGVFDGNWDAVMRFADPAIHGVLGLAQNAGWEAPEVEHVIPPLDAPVEAAWPARRLAISLDFPLPAVNGWEVVDLVRFTLQPDWRY